MTKRRLGLTMVPLMLAAGCGGSGPDPGSDPRPQPGTPWPGDGPTTPFEALPITGQVTKVKYLLTGLAPTKEDIDAVTADPDALRGLIDEWMELPEFQAKMLLFFRNAFQQGQVSASMLNALLGTSLNGDGALLDLLLRNVQDSFPLTVWEIVKKNRPLTDAVTTHEFMLTPPLKALLSMTEALHYNDEEKRDAYQLLDELRGVDIPHRDRDGTPLAAFKFIPADQPQITTAELADPTSPNFLTWSFTATGPRDPAGCENTRFSVHIQDTTVSLFKAAYGFVKGDPARRCYTLYNGRKMWVPGDFDDWQWTTIRKPMGTEAPARFYDVDALHEQKDLVLRTPRVGFFGTLAFQANWLSNRNNLLRVTTNQALIVALGQSIDGEQSIFPLTELSSDESQHADPTSACYACHKTLEPMSRFFAADYTVLYRDQRKRDRMDLTGEFAVDGVRQEGQGVDDIATIMATHPRFATAWAQKLCWYANSGFCAEDDKEFQRVAAAFKDSNFNFKTLVRELFSSPLVTLSGHTTTYDQRDPIVSIAPRNHFCDALSNRLKIADVCSINGRARGDESAQTKKFASAIPIAGYTRGAVDPTTPTESTMIPAAATEKVCLKVAEQVVDSTVNNKYSSATDDDVNLAIGDMVQNVMGLPEGDERASSIVTSLRKHFDSALTTLTAAEKPNSRALALKSTFAVACQAPSLTAVGL